MSTVTGSASCGVDPLLQDVVRAHASARSEHPAVVCGTTVLGYGELADRAERCAAALAAAGVAAGSRVAHLGRDSELYPELLIACALLGAVLVPVDWRLTAGEVDHVLRDSGARLAVVEPRLRELVDALLPGLAALTTVVALEADQFAAWRDAPGTGSPPVAPADRDTPLLQIYTSGTTGKPKGVVLAQRTFFAVRELLDRNGLDWIDWRPGDRSLLALPGFHIGGVWWAVQGLVAGITNVVLPVFDSALAVDLVRDLGITTTCLVPAMLRLVVDEPGVSAEDFHSLRKVVYGGSPISETLLGRCLDVLDCEFAQIYGLTETGNTAVCLPPAEHRAGRERLRAAGRTYPGMRLRIVDERGAEVPAGVVGEVLVHTPARMVEYWHDPGRTAEVLDAGGWIHTGDAGFLDHEGFLYISDRIKDMIVVGGENVYPAEVENALGRHPAVAEAAVVGAPDPAWGERICAFVVARPGTEPCAEELAAFLRGHLAQVKIPTSFDFVASVPRTPSGKILRRTLRDRLWRGMERKVN